MSNLQDELLAWRVLTRERDKKINVVASGQTTPTSIIDPTIHAVIVPISDGNYTRYRYRA